MGWGGRPSAWGLHLLGLHVCAQRSGSGRGCDEGWRPEVGRRAFGRPLSRRAAPAAPATFLHQFNAVVARNLAHMSRLWAAQPFFAGANLILPEKTAALVVVVVMSQRTNSKPPPPCAYVAAASAMIAAQPRPGRTRKPADQLAQPEPAGEI